MCNLLLDGSKSWAAEHHSDELARLHAVLMEEYGQRAGRDQPDSFGGRLSLRIRAGRLFADFLSRQGYTRPRTYRIGHSLGRGVGDAG